ncbi:MAG: helix-turn-helix domain-containing protein [Candidatus Aenigmatarchaeota archaeon]|nr:MAG: helix-turn-helix domain-containing protein [Candidatus Aenigmarchaeota archaeon]
MVDEFHLSKGRLARDITGEIVLSENPEQILKKWRDIFGFSQKKLANHMGITSSVISDYESGRRKSPGINVIKRYVNSLLSLDMKGGGKVIKTFTPPMGSSALSKAIIDIKEFPSGVPTNEFCRKINAPILTKRAPTEREIYGYTIIDSVKAILELSYNQLINLYGTTTQRALVFTVVSTGKTPMVAIKLTHLQPGLVVLHGIDKVDEVAMNIAEVESIPVALCRMETIEDVIKILKEME